MDFAITITGITHSAIDTNTLKLITEYYYKNEAIDSQATKTIDAGKAGTGEANLSTGALKLSFEDVTSNSKVLPISISHTFNSLNAGAKNPLAPFSDSLIPLPLNNCGKGWKTNFNQYVVKETLPDSTFADKQTTAQYTYIDASGSYVIFQDKYYYLDANSEKIYLTQKDVHINQDGKLQFLDDSGVYHKVTKETVSDSGLTLITKYENIQGVTLLDQESDEIVNLKEEVKQLKKTLKELRVQKTNSVAAKELLTLSKQMSDLNEQSQSLSLSNEEADINLQLASKTLNDEYREKYKRYTALVDNRSYMFVDIPTNHDTKATYPTSEEYSLKMRCTNISNTVDTLSQTATWGAGGDDVGTMGRRNQSLQIQKTIFEMNKKYSSAQMTLEMKKMDEQIESIDTSIADYDTLLLKKTHQLALLNEQSPEMLITDSNGNMLGFTATSQSNVYKLFVIMDNYENQIQIIYDNERIEKIVDTDKQVFTFNYNDDGLISSIVDSKSRTTSYVYDNSSRLVEVHYPSSADSPNICKYRYDANDNLVEIVNYNGMGYQFEYSAGKISKIAEISYSTHFSNNGITLSNAACSTNNEITISYNACESTSLTNTETNKTTTYVFDNLGKVINQYNNVFENNAIIGNVDAISYERNGTSSAFTIKECGYAENLLANIQPQVSPTSTVAETYLGSNTECGDDIVALSLADTHNNSTYDVCNAENPIIYKKLPDATIQKIKANKITDLVLSGWAKADATWVSRHNTDYCGHCDPNHSDDELENTLLQNIDSFKKARRFELRAVLTYQNNGQSKTVEQFCSFDWMNTDWQYCAFPVTISEDPNDSLVDIAVYFDYTNNTGNAKFYGMSLKRGEWSYTEFKSGLKSYVESSDSEYITRFEYNNKKKLVKSIIQPKSGGKEYVTTYDYNTSGELVRTVDFTGIVTENTYNDKGTKTKSVTYHKDEPASKLVSLTNVNDKGQETCEYNEFGDKIAESTFADKSGLVETTTDNDGNKVSYGYDVYDDSLLQISTTINNDVNTNCSRYVGGLLTSLTHNNVSVAFEYDGFGRQTKALLCGSTYYSTEYADIVESQTNVDGSTTQIVTGQKATTTNAKNEKFVVYTNLDGNATKIEFVDASGNSSTLVENYYDAFGNLTNTNDNCAQNQISCNYDEFGRLTEKLYSQNNVAITLKNTYDRYGNVSGASIKIG